MIVEPKLQTKLYGHSKVLNDLIKLYNHQFLPSKILLSGPKGIGKSTLSYHLINYVFSKNEKNSYKLEFNEINEENKSFKLLNSFTHPNFYLIDLEDGNKSIEISQVRQMINYTNKSSFNDSPRFILIDNIEKLNINSTNALLKIIEEPNKDIYFILVHNSNKRISETLKSRCLTFKLNLKFNKTLEVVDTILSQKTLELINLDLINYYNTVGDYVNLFNFSNKNNINLKDTNLKSFLSLLIEGNHYKKNNFVKENIFSYIELYFLKVFYKNQNRNELMEIYTQFIQNINNAKNFNLDLESLFMEFKSKILNG